MTIVERRKLKQRVQTGVRDVLIKNATDDEALFLSLLYALEVVNIDLNSFNDIFEEESEV